MKRPISITIVSWMFIATGCVGIIAGLHPFYVADASSRIFEFQSQSFKEFGLICVVEVLALVGGISMFFGFNWARWLCAAWMGYHVILSTMHTILESTVHGALFVGLIYVLFRSHATAYFRRNLAE